MKIQKIHLKAAIAVVLGSVSLNANAALVTDTLLTFESAIGCPVGYYCIVSDGLIYGSYFSMDSDGDGVIEEAEKTAMTPGTDGGIIMGQTQSVGEIDVPWDFFANTGGHLTTSPVNLVNDLGTIRELDFAGWSMDWNGYFIPLGGDTANITADTGLATITCATLACADGESYILDYAAHVPLNDPSGFGGVAYTLHLEGTISAVPVPAAVWLFGSGLFALTGIARRRKAT